RYTAKSNSAATICTAARQQQEPGSSECSSSRDDRALHLTGKSRIVINCTKAAAKAAATAPTAATTTAAAAAAMDTESRGASSVDTLPHSTVGPLGAEEGGSTIVNGSAAAQAT